MQLEYVRSQFYVKCNEYQFVHYVTNCSYHVQMKMILEKYLKEAMCISGLIMKKTIISDLLFLLRLKYEDQYSFAFAEKIWELIF